MAKDFPIKLGAPGSNHDVLLALRNSGISWGLRPRLHWEQRVRLRDFTGIASTSQALNLNSLFPRNVFPRFVDILEGTKVRNVSLAAGTSITAVSIQLGDALDVNGLLESSSVLGGGATAGATLQTPAAAEYADHPEAGFVPLLTITCTGGNTNALTNLDVVVDIPWTPWTEI